jgi:hypothetical protein
LTSLDGNGALLRPGCVRRIEDIFEHPQFRIDDYATGSRTLVSVEGYQYLIAAVAAFRAIAPPGDRIFAARDEQVDIYGFCFFRGKTPTEGQPRSATFFSSGSSRMD